MKIKRYLASSMREAIRHVREELGPEAVILSNRRVTGGLEVVAATDYDAALVQAAIRREAGEPPAGAAPEPAVQPRPEPRLEAGSGGPGPDPRPGIPRRIQPQLPLIAPPVVAAEAPAPELRALREEIQALRARLDARGPGPDKTVPLHPHPGARTAALRTLAELGVESSLAHEVLKALPASMSETEARQMPLAALAQRLPVTAADPVLEGGIIALVGATGVGKTTTLAKLAARFAEAHGTREIALLTTDHYRVGAQEQLFTYGRLLGVPVQSVGSAEALKASLLRLADRKLVLIDTAGMAPRDQQLALSLAELKAAGRPIQRWLVLSATTQLADQLDLLRCFAPAEPSAAVITKLDESTRLGGVLSALIRHGLPVAYTADGQRVPEDLAPASAEGLWLKALHTARRAAAPITTPERAHAHG